MTRKDWLVMLAVTLIYAVVAFMNLGSLDIPETFFTMDNENDEIIVEFAEPQTIETIKYYTSLGEGVVTIFYSNDGESYTLLTAMTEDENGETVEESVTIDHDDIDMYEWQFFIGIVYGEVCAAARGRAGYPDAGDGVLRQRRKPGRDRFGRKYQSGCGKRQ